MGRDLWRLMKESYAYIQPTIIGGPGRRFLHAENVEAYFKLFGNTVEPGIVDGWGCIIFPSGIQQGSGGWMQLDKSFSQFWGGGPGPWWKTGGCGLRWIPLSPGLVARRGYQVCCSRLLNDRTAQKKGACLSSGHPEVLYVLSLSTLERVAVPSSQLWHSSRDSFIAIILAPWSHNSVQKGCGLGCRREEGSRSWGRRRRMVCGMLGTGLPGKRNLAE